MPRARILVYLNDILIAANSLLAERALQVVVGEVAVCGFESAPDKLKVWVPDGSPPHLVLYATRGPRRVSGYRGGW